MPILVIRRKKFRLERYTKFTLLDFETHSRERFVRVLDTMQFQVSTTWALVYSQLTGMLVKYHQAMCPTVCSRLKKLNVMDMPV